MPQTALFRKIPLLSDLPRDELDRLAAGLGVVALEAGQVLFKEGEPGESLYVVLEGRLQILLAMDSPDEKQIALLGPGEFIGEMSLLIPDRARTASARAAEASRLWQMTRADFDALLVRQPQLAYVMVRTLTKRLDATTSAGFRDLQEKNRQLQQAYDALKAAQAQIIEKERLERELQLAAEIQISILPRDLPQVPGFDFGAVIRPARMVGGDFFDVFSLDKRRIGVVIGDVADKGVPSAIFMARAHALIMAEASHGGSPGDILQRANQHLIQLAQADLFVTVLLGILDLQTARFSYARAGHELPLWRAANGRVRVSPRAPGQPIGVLDRPLLDENTIQLLPGGTLVLFTDGVTDERNPAGETFGHQRLRAELGAHTGRTAHETCERLLACLRKFQAKTPQEDDITLVAIHRIRSAA
jgi:sigma-B regulation protein RsbU (phosphoserine phosphatase)